MKRVDYRSSFGILVLEGKWRPGVLLGCMIFLIASIIVGPTLCLLPLTRCASHLVLTPESWPIASAELDFAQSQLETTAIACKVSSELWQHPRCFTDQCTWLFSTADATDFTSESCGDSIAQRCTQATSSDASDCQQIIGYRIRF